MSSMLLRVCKYIFFYFYNFLSMQYNFHKGNTIKLYLLPDYNKPSEAITFQSLAMSASSKK
jgi:energy-coupling factor transporter transmembrane protein EcfT